VRHQEYFLERKRKVPTIYMHQSTDYQEELRKKIKEFGLSG
jgi:hypothetical protein